MLNSKKFTKRIFILFLAFTIFAYGIVFSFDSGKCCNNCNCKPTEKTTVRSSETNDTIKKEKTSESTVDSATSAEQTIPDSYTHHLVYDIKQSKKEIYLSVAGLYTQDVIKKVVIPETVVVTIPADYLPNEEYYINHKTENFIITDEVALTAGKTYKLKVKEIGIMAFANNQNIEEVMIPDIVTVIDLFAFSECINLKKINIPKNLKIVANHAFESCNNLEKISYKGNVNSLSGIDVGDDNKPFQHLIKTTVKENTTVKSSETTVKNKNETTRKENK